MYALLLMICTVSYDPTPITCREIPIYSFESLADCTDFMSSRIRPIGAGSGNYSSASFFICKKTK